MFIPSLTSDSVLQVVLLASREDLFTQALTKKLKELTGCEVMQVGDEPLRDVQAVVEEKKLEWKDVAYMGKTVRLFIQWV